MEHIVIQWITGMIPRYQLVSPVFFSKIFLGKNSYQAFPFFHPQKMLETEVPEWEVHRQKDLHGFFVKSWQNYHMDRKNHNSLTVNKYDSVMRQLQ
ncbi:MAG: hypothetical protein AAF587_00340 [Bacteroidota bacterium]